MKAKSSSGSLPDYSAYRGVYIEDVDGYLYTESEWDGSKTPNGIAVLTDNCRFVMALQDAYSSYCRWGGYGTEVSGITTTTDSSTAATDYDGEGNTAAIINALNGTNDGYVDGAPAAEYCRAYTFPNGATGYMGAAGEWQAALDNKAAIISALSKCGGTSMSDYYWTSTQYSSDRSWYMHWYSEYLRNDTKYDLYYVRAFTSFTSLKSDEEESGGGAGKVVNRATLRTTGGLYNGDFLYPVESDIVVTFYNPYVEGMYEYTVKTGTTHVVGVPDGTFSYTPAEDDIYVYEITFE